MASKKKIIRGNQGPAAVGTPHTGVVNRGNIDGGSSSGLTVTGTAANSVVNKGMITGTTGLSVSGSTSKIVNSGLIKGYSLTLTLLIS